MAQQPDTTRFVDTTTLRVAVLLVQFADHATNPDARGSFGFSPPPALDTIENKYRYGDYWNIFFQASGPVIHPENDFPPEYSVGKKGFFQYGSLRRYLEDNSFGLKTIVPYRAWSASSGLINPVIPDTSGDPNRAIVCWLTIDSTKRQTWNPNPQPTFESPDALGQFAIAAAIDSFAVAWDSLDVVLLLYAGVNHLSYSTPGRYTDNTDTVYFAITSERAWPSVAGITTFAPPRVIWHEFLHSVLNAQDLHHRNRKFIPEGELCIGVGHFSLMGDNSQLGAYTPEMLDPWHRLRGGWLRYYVPGARFDSLDLRTPLDTTNFHLPIVEERWNGEVPYVLVIPVKDHPDIQGWNSTQQKYIIVENRRAVGWDSVIVREENVPEGDPDYGQTFGKTGGFLIWGVVNPGSDLPAWIFDADDVFSTWEVPPPEYSRYGSPDDLFTGVEGHNVFSISSSPSVFTIPNPGVGSGAYALT